METYNNGKLPPPNPQRVAGQKAADARWGRQIERATHQGQIAIADTVLDCYVLEDGRRVINQASIMEILGRSKSTGRRTRNDNMPPFVEANNLRPYITPELRSALERIEFRVGDAKQTKSGFDAEMLPRICHVYLDAKEDGVLIPNQQPAASAAQRVVKALSLVGITALVDEATGYQETRAKEELQRLLDAYISEEFRPWTRKFPETFFKELYRLYGWKFKPGNHTHPQYVGQFINKYVYGAMPPGVLDELRKINPKNENGNRARKHHQHLTEEYGESHLKSQISQVITLMQASEDRAQFENLHSRVTDRNRPVQQMLQLDVTSNSERG